MLKNIFKDEDGQMNNDILMLYTYIMLAVIFFISAITYYYLLPNFGIIFMDMGNVSTQSGNFTVSPGVYVDYHDTHNIMNRILWSIRMGTIVTMVGSVVFAVILRATRKEYDSY